MNSTSVPDSSGFHMIKYKPLGQFVLLIACCFAPGIVASAQDDTPNAPAEVPLRKDVDPFGRVKYTRLTEEAFLAAATPNDPEWGEPTRMLHWVRAGDWEAIGIFLKLFEPEAAVRIHTKICSDLTYANPKATMLPADVIGLADASLGELNERQSILIGDLLRNTMRETESRTELMKRLQRGTARLGGTNVERRRLTARILARAELHTEAQTFGMTEAELRALRVGPDQSPTMPRRNWTELIASLRDSLSHAEARDKHLDVLHQWFVESTPKIVEQQLRDIMADAVHPELTTHVFAMIGRQTAAAGREVDLDSRAVHLEMEHTAMQLLAASKDINDEPWKTMASLTANNWVTEARNSHKIYPAWLRSTEENRVRYPHVPLEKLIQSAPSGKWLDAVLPQLAASVRITLTRLILFTEEIDRALPQLLALQRYDTPKAAELANEYLDNWARRHDPNLSPELLRQYRFDKQVVVLTRAQQKTALVQLGQLLSSLDDSTRALLDEEHLVQAFDFCHSRAEIYTREHMVKVFGPLEDIPSSLAVRLVEKMRDKLALQWRELSVQSDAATRRNTADIFNLVNQGYFEATTIAVRWLESQKDSSRMESVAGSLYADWAEFAYFQSVATEDRSDRFAEYLKHTQQAQTHFRAGAIAYAALVPNLRREDFDLMPYRAWFYGLLGITHDGGINLRKGVTRDGLQELRQAMLDLPGGANEVHLQLFSTMVAENIEANRIAPEMKYRYLSSAVRVTGSRSTIYPAEEKIKYYDSLLQEIRLETRIHGSDRVHTNGEFGVFVSLVHTADVARESGGFAMYLQNKVQRTVSGRNVVEKPLYRDRLEESLRLTLGNFFDIRSIIFANPADGTRDMPSATRTAEGAPNRVWQETPLCYLLLATKDVTVDRVPALEIQLDFFDREGKVVIPVPSNPLQIEIAEDAPVERPVGNVSVTQIVDSRELSNNLLKINVSATADGLLPDLESILNLSGYSLSILDVVNEGSLQVKRLHNGPKGLFPQSERSWTVHLDPTRLLRGASQRIDFEFPAAVSAETEMVYLRFEDMDPVEAAAQVTLVEGEAVATLAQVDYRLWGSGVVAVVLALAGVVVLLVRSRRTDAAEPPPLFSLPTEFTPFSVIALLHRIKSSPIVDLTDDQRLSLQGDMNTLEQLTFSREGNTSRTQDMESLAHRWLETALSPVRRSTAIDN